MPLQLLRSLGHKMLTIVGIFILIRRKKSCLDELSMKKFFNLGAKDNCSDLRKKQFLITEKKKKKLHIRCSHTFSGSGRGKSPIICDIN